MAVADVVVDIDAAVGQSLRVSLTGGRVRVLRAVGGDHGGRRDIVEKPQVLFVIPACTDVPGQMLVLHPVVLKIQAVLIIAGGCRGAQARHWIREQRLVGQRVRACGSDVVEELRIDVFGVSRRQVDSLDLGAGLDRVIAEPMQVAEGEVVLDAGSALPFVLRGTRIRGAGGKNELLVVGHDDVLRAVAEIRGRWLIEGVLVREQQFIQPVIRTVRPAQACSGCRCF